MADKIKVAAKSEKQALSIAAQQLNLEENFLNVKLIEKGKKLLFGIFKELPKYEISYSLENNIESGKLDRAKKNKSGSGLGENEGFALDPNVKYYKIEDIPNAYMQKKARIACEYLDSILKSLDVGEIKQEIEFDYRNNLEIKLSGENIAVVVGKFGEVLNAIQYLVVLSANRDGGQYMKVILDSGDFRKNRRKSLQDLGKRVATTAIEKSKSIVLEPMNPYERRVIHACISKMEGVYSRSIGTDPNRRVIVYPASGWTGEPLDYKKPSRSKQPYLFSNQKNHDSKIVDIDSQLHTYDFEKEFLKVAGNEHAEYEKVDLK